MLNKIGLTLGLFGLIALVNNASAQNPSSCPATRCIEAKYLCSDSTETFACQVCGMALNNNVWRYFTTPNSGQIISVSSSPGMGFNNVLVYGPFNGMPDCGVLGTSLIPSVSGTLNYQFTLPSAGTYVIHSINANCADVSETITYDFTPDLSCTMDTAAILDTCASCVGSFALIPDKRYLMSAWAKEDGAPLDLSNYVNPEIYIDFTLMGGGFATVGPFKPSGQIIDSWQRIEEEFDVPANAEGIDIRLSSINGDVFFDDIRILPFDASMKTYVYDPVYMRLAAEMDERHYATFYEYDEEGKLIRIKKETEKGIMTIQETRNNTSK